MAINLSESELAALQGMEVQAQAKQIGFWQIYEWLANVLIQKGMSSLDSTVLWLRGATEANEGQGAMSVLIREYTNTQYQLRYGCSVSAALMQEASNAVAQNLINELLGRNAPAWPRSLVPDIARIAESDARGVGEALFGPSRGHDTNDIAFTHSTWSGTLLFGSKYCSALSRWRSAANDCLVQEVA